MISRRVRLVLFPSVLFLLVQGGICCRVQESQASAPAPTPVPPARESSSASPDPRRLVGRWRRADSDYTIEVAGVGTDGKLEARYLNPNPIHVGRAEAKVEGGVLRMLLELQDRGYPGSYYELVYDAGSDSLTGVYHHLGLRRDFDVGFSRLSDGGGALPAR